MQHVPSRSSLLSGAALIAAMCTPLFGCSDSLSGNLTGSGASALSIRLTDAPGDVQHAVVTISKIYLQGSESDTGSIVLMSTPVTTDLTTLAHTTTSLVQNVSVPAGKYSQLRFVVTGAYIAVDDGHGGSTIYATSSDYAGLPAGSTVSGTLRCPSCAQSGLKVILPGDSISVAGNQSLTVDFNVAESFGHQAGNSGQWIMHPVLKAISVGTVTAATYTTTIQTSDTSVKLPIVGTDTVTFSAFSAVLTPPSGPADTVAFSGTTTAGLYAASFANLLPGTYTVSILAPSAVTAFVTAPTIPQTITIASGANDTTAFHLTSVTP